MVNNTSCIVFGCSKKGIWDKTKNTSSKKTATIESGHVEDRSEVTQDDTSSEERRSFYRFPAINPKAGIVKQRLQEDRRKKWLVAIKRKDISEAQLKHLRICSRHFISGVPAALDDVSNPDWTPSENLGYKKSGPQAETATARYNRHVEREMVKSSRRVQELAAIDNDSCEGVLADNNSTDDGVGTQTDLSYTTIQAMEMEIQKQKERIQTLELQVARLSLKKEGFVNEDKKVLHYTGLPSYVVLGLILSRMNGALNTVKAGRLDNFQKLVLVLMKLKMNVSFVGLSYRFDIRVSEASTCFKKVIILLEYAFSALVHWPDRESLRTAMPESFKKAFGNSVAVIIDCFEITSEKPSNLKAKAQSYSQYKHNYTIKYLIGIVPQGAVSFISQGYGGRTTDNFITRDSGFLDKLEIGDVVLADRGFTIKEEFSMLYAELMTPQFLMSKKQLPAAAIEKTRKIASVRIHVERVIGLVKNKFKILKGTVPINFLKEKYGDKCFFDYIVRVCCILTNMCDSIVPMNKSVYVNANVDVALNAELFNDNFDFCV